MVFPYLSIYIVALGATGTQLGMVNSIGMIIAGLFGPFTGWFIDRIGPKKIYLVGIGFMAVSYLTYGLAQSWEVTIIAMIAYWLGFSTSTHSCATICGNCLVNRDRATGMLICETVAAGLLGMAGPMLATWLVARFGRGNHRRDTAAVLLGPPDHGRHVRHRPDPVVGPDVGDERRQRAERVERHLPGVQRRQPFEKMAGHRLACPSCRQGWSFPLPRFSPTR